MEVGSAPDIVNPVLSLELASVGPPITLEFENEYGGELELGTPDDVGCLVSVFSGAPD